MRNFLCLFMLAFLATAMIAACGGDTGSSNNTTSSNSNGVDGGDSNGVDGGDQPDGTTADAGDTGRDAADAAADANDAGESCEDGWTGPECDQCVVYVDGDGDDGNSGKSWAQAFASVGAGIDLADARLVTEGLDSCSVWVGAGVYVPGEERTDSFELAPGVQLYGGFDGTEERRSERDFESNRTTLSGDLDQNDDPEDDATLEDNVLHVVLGADDAVVDGFTITAGVADPEYGSDRVPRGGGLYNDDASPTIRNTRFVRNHADSEGGAVSNRGDSAPTFSDIVFSENNARDSGGAMHYAHDSGGTVERATFSDNTATVESGGAVYIDDDSASRFEDVTFTGNRADEDGGALCITNDGEVIVDGATFENNETLSGSGGALFYDADLGDEILTLLNVDFQNNVASTSGGAAALDGLSGVATITNARFVENYAGGDGGAIDSDVDLTLTNVTITENSSAAIHDGLTGSLEIRNSILWDNQGSELSLSTIGDYFITHSIIDGGRPDEVDEDDYVLNLDENPLFVEAPANLALLDSSPGIDAGNSGLANLPDEDLAGNPRIVDGDADGDANIDMGAYEFQP